MVGLLAVRNWTLFANDGYKVIQIQGLNVLDERVEVEDNEVIIPCLVALDKPLVTK